MPENRPQPNWGEPKRIIWAYSHYHSTIPKNALNPRFFEILGKLRGRLHNAHERLRSWDKVSQEDPWRPVPPGTLSTFAKDGYLPVKWFDHFGLPTFKPAPVCHSCEEVHTTKRCTKKQPKHKDLFSMPVDELRRRLDERS